MQYSKTRKGCLPASRKRPLSSYVDGFDEHEKGWNLEKPRAKVCTRHEKAHGVHARNYAEDAYNSLLANTVQTATTRNRLQPPVEANACLYGPAW
jgi:hypothetical protein